MQAESIDTTPMDKDAVAKYLGIGVPQIAKLVAKGLIPDGRTMGGKKKYWFKMHLDQYRAQVMNSVTAEWTPKTVTEVAAPVNTPVAVKRGPGRPRKAPLSETKSTPTIVPFKTVEQLIQEKGLAVNKPVLPAQTKPIWGGKRELMDREDRQRRQKLHIQESYQDAEVLDDGCAEHLKSILGDLSDYLKSRKG